MRAKRRKPTSSGTHGEKARITPKRRLDFDHRDILDALEVGVASVTAKGITCYANRRFGDMVGAPPFKSVQGSNLRWFVSAESWPALIAALRRGARIPSEGLLELEGTGPKRTVRVSFIPLRSKKHGP